MPIIIHLNLNMPLADPWENDKPKSQIEINHLATLISILVYRNLRDDFPEDVSTYNIFRSHSIAHIGIKDYIFRFVQAARLNESELIGSLIILDRFLSYTQESVTSYNVHRLIGIALIIAQKNFSDKPLNMASYAHIYGVSLRELLDIEEKFLHSIDFNLFTIPDHFLHYKNRLVTLARELEGTNIGRTRLGPFAVRMSDKEKKALCTSLFTLNEERPYTVEISDATFLASSIIGEKIGNIPRQVRPSSLNFYCQSIPSISIIDYISDLVRDIGVDENQVIGVLILLDRYLSLPDQNLNLLNVHSLIAVAFVVAQKSFSDTYYDMSHYAKASSISFALLLELEEKFISDIDFNVFVSREDFLTYKNKLVLRARELETIGYEAFNIGMTTEEEKAFCSRQALTISEKPDNLAENDTNVNETPNPLQSPKESKTAEKKSSYSPRFSAKPPTSTNEEHSSEATKAPTI